MRRPQVILLAVILAAAAVFGLSYYVTARLSARHLARTTDDLEWLRREFQLSPTDLARVRTLHEGYLPQCRVLCARIAERRQALQRAVQAGSAVTQETERLLAEIAALRAECQTHMLRHFADVSRAMPAAQGRRYLTEMRRLTLGFHEQTERTMSAPPPHAHGPE